MKTLTTLLLAIAFMGPAFAQEKPAEHRHGKHEKPACCEGHDGKCEEGMEGKEGKACCQDKDGAKVKGDKQFHDKDGKMKEMRKKKGNKKPIDPKEAK